ncbi:MAG TPA: beta-galactosidase [Armatimonadota bacterium]|jgi:hypothetical protein
MEVRLTDGAVRLNGTPVPLFSGEVHYWRLFRERWPRVLQSVKDMGLSGIATYVQWGDAEIAPGDYDFTGRTAPQRDLAGFLELCAEMGLWVVLRPGPYIYAETPNMGVADRAAPYHRLHPMFLSMAREYMAAVTAAAAPFLATRGGPIVVWQADNEIDPTIPHYETQLGLAGEPGMFQEWLSRRYDTVAALNAAWGTAYPAFAAARAFNSPMGGDPKWRRRWLDLIAWKWDYIETYAKWVSDGYKELGVDVPILINMFPGVGEHHWRSMQRAGDFIGLDTYPANEFRAEPSEHRRFIEKVRVNAAISRLPYIAEFESGVWHGHHHYAGALTGRHYRLAAYSALLGGARGWNWYMIAERDNWQDCPINALGGKRHALFDAFRSVMDAVNAHEPGSWRRLTDTAVTFCTAHYAHGKPAADDPSLTALYDADVDYAVFDLEGDAPPTSALCFYSGHPWLPRAQGDALRRWVEAGGNLVCWKNYPRQDDYGADYDPLEIGQPVGSTWFGKSADLTLGEHAVPISGALWEWKADNAEALTAVQRPPAMLFGEEEAIQLANEEGRVYTIGFRRRLGQGTVTMLGCDANPALVVALHGWFGLTPPSRSETPGVQTALFEKPNGSRILAAVNNGEEAKAAVVRLADGSALIVSLPAKDGRLLEA